MFFPFMLPALLAPAQEAAVPGAVELYPNLLVFRGVPDASAWAAAKAAGIDYVMCLRRDGEPGFNPGRDQQAISAAGLSYVRLAVPRVPTVPDLDLFRSAMRDLPPRSKVMLYCANGNRAAALAFIWITLDRRMAVDQALHLAKRAGLSDPGTEQAVRAYVERRRS